MEEIKTQRQFSGPEFIPKTPSQKSSNTAIKTVIGAVIGVLIVIGGSLFLRIWDPLWNPFRPSPEKVLSETWGKMEEVKTFHTDGKMFLGIYPAEQPKTEVSFSFAGDSDATDPENPKSSGQFQINAFLPQQGHLSLSMESRTIGEDSYLKFKIPSYLHFFLIFFYGIDVEKLDNKWVKFNREDLDDLFGAYSQQELSQEQEKILIEKIRKTFKESKIFYVKRELSDKIIDGANMYHYELGLDKEKVKETLPELLEALMEAPNQQIGEFESAFILGGITRLINEFFDNIGEITFETWISKKDLYLYKVKGEVEIDLSKLSAGKEKGKINTRAEINHSNFNQVVKIEKPEEFIFLKEVFLQEFPGLPEMGDNF